MSREAHTTTPSTSRTRSVSGESSVQPSSPLKDPVASTEKDEKLGSDDQDQSVENGMKRMFEDSEEDEYESSKKNMVKDPTLDGPLLMTRSSSYWRQQEKFRNLPMYMFSICKCCAGYMGDCDYWELSDYDRLRLKNSDQALTRTITDDDMAELLDPLEDVLVSISNTEGYCMECEEKCEQHDDSDLEDDEDDEDDEDECPRSWNDFKLWELTHCPWEHLVEIQKSRSAKKLQEFDFEYQEVKPDPRDLCFLASYTQLQKLMNT